MTTARQEKMLTFEREWWRHAGDKPGAIRAVFDMTPAAYHRELDGFIFDDDVLEADRPLVKRLRRLSAQRRRAAS